ncbi:MAG TPA: hypothetical protein VGP82_07285 [Ktedonobacterales bacterium]|nr:hypothetical protein [Ktedonobacterales bacterium]
MTKSTGHRDRRARTAANVEAPLHLELAAEAVLDGWTREQVIDTLIGRISRDRRYLAYRKACNRRTGYDDQVQQDMRALALAACWLDEALASMGDVLGVQQREQRHEHAQRQPHSVMRRGLPGRGAPARPGSAHDPAAPYRQRQ